MPMKRHLYPPNWSEISQRIRARARNRCEWCGVPNHAIGYREKNGTFVQLAPSIESAGMECEAAALDGHKVIRIVLTVAHYPDPTPSNCADDNLQALCQRCHLQTDRDYHNKQASKTRAAKRAAGVLQIDFDSPASAGVGG